MLAKRPILLGGLGLSATLWLIDTIHFDLFDSSTLLSAIALGSGVWWWQRQRHGTQVSRTVALAPVDRTGVEQAIAAVTALVDTLEAEGETLQAEATPTSLSIADCFRQQIAHLSTQVDRTALTIGILGARGTGKSKILAHLQALGAVRCQPQSPARIPQTLSFREFALPATPAAVADELAHQDALLFVSAGDLTDSEFTVLRQRVEAGQRVAVLLNKQDHYLPQEQTAILERLQQRLAQLPQTVTVAAIAAAPRPLKVRRHQADGQVEEWLEPAAPDIAALSTILEHLHQDTAALVLATTLRQTQTLRRQVQIALNGVRRDRALPLVEQLQWVAAVSAFASPVPTLDVLATVAVNAQLVMDLGKVYGFTFSLDEAKATAGTLARLTVKLGLVELSTQVLTTALKSQMATYVAGGVVQGLSAAYLTRVAGLSLIEFFEAAALAGNAAPSLSLEGISQRLQAVFQQSRQGAFLQLLVQQGLERLRPAAPALEVVPSA